jgi:hypothetical protein
MNQAPTMPYHEFSTKNKACVTSDVKYLKRFAQKKPKKAILRIAFLIAVRTKIKPLNL